jgi:hypothetical protein
MEEGAVHDKSTPCAGARDGGDEKAPDEKSEELQSRMGEQLFLDELFRTASLFSARGGWLSYLMRR